MPHRAPTLLLALTLATTALAQPPAPDAPPPPPLDWKSAESPLLGDHVQLTFRDKFVKAGESYFNPSGKFIIFQATRVPESGTNADPFYAMYVAKFAGAALTDLTRVSPLGSANTCGWFSPRGSEILFGSTRTRPQDEEKSGFQVGSRRYVWMFPKEMEIVTYDPLFVTGGVEGPKGEKPNPKVNLVENTGKGNNHERLVFSRPNYDAECSYDKSGRFILYAHIEDAKEGEKPDANIYIYDTKTRKHHPIIVAPGYDGGPFFSPDDKMICYRSDRKGNDLLQIFVASLKFEKDADGVNVPVGITQEYQLTDNQHVNWCPYWHPSGKFLVYATSEVSHRNYEVFAIETDIIKLLSSAAAQTKESNRTSETPKTVLVKDLRSRRITHADGADVLPAFSFDGKYLMWTSQRAPKIDGEDKPSSQLWIAEWKGGDNPFAPPKEP